MNQTAEIGIVEERAAKSSGRARPGAGTNLKSASGVRARSFDAKLPMNLSSRNSLIAAAASFLAATALTTGALAQNIAAPPAPSGGAQKAISAPNEANSTYLRDVLPIFAGKCARCHNQQSALANWMDYKTAFGDRREIRRRVWDSFKGHYYKQPMPAGNSPEAQALTDEERALIKEWVDGGAACGTPDAGGSPASKPDRIEKGKKLFAVVCSACHQTTGQGIPDKFPPLAGSDFLNADKNRAIKVLLHGRQGEITVNGQKFNNSMPSFPLSDDDIASALTFVYNSFGNSGKDVTSAEVKAMRAEKVEPVPATVVAHSAAEASPFE